MSTESKKSYASTIVLIALGLTALVTGTKWLIVLLPAAVIIYLRVRPTLHGGRN